jgi:tetratricopeptide (TPR) repeat protein
VAGACNASYTSRPAEALEAVEKAIRLDPRNPGNLFFRGMAYTLLGRYEEAITDLKRSPVNDLWHHVFLVSDYIELGQEDDARAEVAEVERRCALDHSSPIGYLALAFVMNRMAEPKEALVAVEEAMRLDPGDRDALLLYEAGLAYQGLGRYQDSITAYKRYLAHYPGFFYAHCGLAVDYAELGQDDAARAEVAEALKLFPQLTVATLYPTVGPKGKLLAEQTRWSADLRKIGLK